MSSLVFSGDTSGSVTISSPAISGSSVLTLPAVTDTLVGLAATQTLTNKTLTAPVLGTPASGNLANCTGITVAALSTASGSAPSFSARCWVNFNGNGTIAIKASANVSSLTDNGTGDYSVNFTTAMADADYAWMGATGTDSSGTGFVSGPTLVALATWKTSALIRIGTCTSNSVQADNPEVTVSTFR